MTQDVFILFTMDVERSTTAAGVSGPRSDAEGARSIEGYRDALDAFGYRGTYFVHPEVAEVQTDLFLRLRDEGAALGLHLHTTKFRDAPTPVELGGLTAGEQRAILGRAARQFGDALGFRPELFRPGCFSANDATYGVLTELGFTGGSVCVPGRVWPDRFCVWAGAYPYARLAHAAFRQLPGDLPFVEVPLSVDMTRPLIRHPVGFLHYPDLRPGGVYTKAQQDGRDHRTLLGNILRRMAEDDPPVKTLVVDIHNDRDFTSPDSEAARHLRALLEGIEPEAAAAGLRPRGSTMAEVAPRVGGASPGG